MPTTLAVTEAITSLNEAESTFNLCRSAEADFFNEWLDLTEVSASEKQALDRIKNSYLYNSADGALTEATVNLLLISPLLYLAGFCDPPFKLRAEKAVDISAKEDNKVYKGRIDALILQNQLWLFLIESKQAKFSFSIAIPQALAYMVANPNQDKPIYGLVTNGDNFLFIKLQKGESNLYDFSTDFSIFARPHNELYQVLSLMKKLRDLM